MSREYICSICGETGARGWEGIMAGICEKCKSRLLTEDVPSHGIYQMIKTNNDDDETIKE